MNTELLYTGDDCNDNWLFNKYYYSGGNARYCTTQLALNLLFQFTEKPIIIETGCQRQEDDIGAGMSTSIFAEYISRYGGRLISVDNNEHHLRIAEACVAQWSKSDMSFICSDSVRFLEKYKGSCDLLYLDSWDYPYVELANMYCAGKSFEFGVGVLKSMGRAKLLELHEDMITPCQEHAVKEFVGIEGNFGPQSLVLIDDNQFAGGGKSYLLKQYLLKQGWLCLFDFQSTLWIKKVQA